MGDSKNEGQVGDPRDYVLDLSSLGAGGADKAGEVGKDAGGRPFLSVYFKCCGVYNRIYKTVDGTAYAGFCPRCAAPIRAAIGPGGTTQRSFVAE